MLSPILCDPMDCGSKLLCPWGFPGKNIGVGCHFPSPEYLPYPGIEPASPALQSDSLPTEPVDKPIELFKCLCIPFILKGSVSVSFKTSSFLYLHGPLPTCYWTCQLIRNSKCFIPSLALSYSLILDYY